MKRGALIILAGTLFLTGVGILSYPDVRKLISDHENKDTIARFQEERQQVEEAAEDEPYAELLRCMQDYNARIYADEQKELKDAWSYEQNPFDLDTAGLPEHMVGYLTIEAMDQKLPLYIGASDENMSRGAAVLSQTSMPVGGENTNCVIAAHRGYSGIPMFRDIEELEPGDRVEVANLWDTLEYEVVKSIVISPDDIDAVKIVPGEDLLTLITCHPYTQNYQRYVVYCRRTPDERQGEESGGEDPLLGRTGIAYVSSGGEIRKERLLDGAALSVCLALCAAPAAVWLVQRRKGRRKNGSQGPQRESKTRRQ